MRVSVKYYRDLLEDGARIEAFRRAIAATVRPGDRVLDVGTGLGTFAFFAADAGADTVWAVDGDAVVHVAKMVARLNGYDERVHFVRGWLPDVAIPGRATVVVFEDFPPTLLDARVARLLRHVHERLVTPDARFIPARGTLRAAPVASAELWQRVMTVAGTESRYGIDWSASRDYVANTPHHLPIPERAVASEPATVCTLDFAAAAPAWRVGGTARWVFREEAAVHGLACWFDLDLGHGEHLSNAPGAVPGTWGQVFLPVDPPLPVRAGRPLDARIGMDEAGDGLPSWLSWTLASEDERRAGHEFAALPASLGDLRAGASDAVPRLSAGGRRALRVLGLVDGRRSVADIARAVGEVEGLPMLEAQRLVIAALGDEITRDGGLKDHVPGRPTP